MPIIRFPFPRARAARIRRSGPKWRTHWLSGLTIRRRAGVDTRTCQARHFPLEPDVGRALERKNPSRVVGRGNFEPQPFDDLPHRANLRPVGFGELARAEPPAVL